MASVKTPPQQTEDPQIMDRAKDFWVHNGKIVTISVVIIVVLLGGFLAYKYFIQRPNEQKATDAIYHAEILFRQDSFRLALEGDGVNPGFIRIIDRYGGTQAGNLAKFYAGSSFLQLGDFANASKHLNGFSTNSKPVQARAYKLLGDALAEQGKNDDALSNYKKAARHFEEDDQNASEYLFIAAYFAHRVMQNENEARDLYRELKQKFPRSERGFEVDKYLGQLGVYSSENK